MSDNDTQKQDPEPASDAPKEPETREPQGETKQATEGDK